MNRFWSTCISHSVIRHWEGCPPLARGLPGLMAPVLCPRASAKAMCTPALALILLVRRHFAVCSLVVTPPPPNGGLRSCWVRHPPKGFCDSVPEGLP